LRSFVGQQFEAGLLVHDFASERIYQTNMMIHIRPDQRMRFIVSREEFVNDYSFVDEIDFKITTAQPAAIVFQFVRRADDGGNAMRREVISQQNKFVRCRQILPIENRNVRRPGAVPFAVSTQQRFVQPVDPGRTDASGSAAQASTSTAIRIAAGLAPPDRKDWMDFRVVFDKFDLLPVNEPVEPSSNGGACESRIDKRDFLFGFR